MVVLVIQLQHASKDQLSVSVYEVVSYVRSKQSESDSHNHGYQVCIPANVSTRSKMSRSVYAASYRLKLIGNEIFCWQLHKHTFLAYTI